MESAIGTNRGLGVDPRPVGLRPGKFHPGGKEKHDDYICNHHLSPDQDHQGFAYSSSPTEVGDPQGRLIPALTSIAVYITAV
jgi:hypothetical protein